MKKEDLINLGTGVDGDDSMAYSLAKGHLSDKDFSNLFNMSWNGDPLENDRISHEYWVEKEDGSWKSSNKNDPKAVPVTITDW